MKQRYDLLAFSLLVFSVVALVCLTADPKGFSLKDWQPLIASFVALGAASLAYKAAMAKVEFDREIAGRTDRRKLLGLCLRLEYALRVLKHEADTVQKYIPEGYVFTDMEIDRKDLTLGPPRALDEAWDNLDAFRRVVSQELAIVRGAIYDYESRLAACSQAPILLKSPTKVPPELTKVRVYAGHLSDSIERCLQPIVRQISELKEW
ncbi:hypothetical protein QRQ56_09900 [Bradyrhizobium sp. U531]|uniref:hypothetical protein n=1 Tax=Bradyrhizobium sp. U531 TaxID=3053458 RepID=UPI003F42E100